MTRFLFDARVPARDGVELSVDVYLPETAGPVPAILHRTPYDNANSDIVATARYFADRGYAYVAADVRGRGDSGGVFAPFRGEGPDGYDTVEWVAAQPWCDGKVGMMGGSYAGSTQWWAARLRPPHLVTMVSTATSGLQVQEPQRRGKLRPSLFLWLHRIAGHTMQPGLPPGSDGPGIDWRAVLTHRPYRDIDIALGRRPAAWREWLAHRDPAYWDGESAFHSFDRIGVPVLHVSGWHDGSIVGELLSYQGVRDAGVLGDRHFLLVGPWNHAGTRHPTDRLGAKWFTEAAAIDINAVHLRWFDHWLKGIDTGLLGEPRVRVFTMGVNRWQTLDAWPPPAREARWYLHSGGHANTRAGDGRLDTTPPGDTTSGDIPPGGGDVPPGDAAPDGGGAEPDRYRYDPADPTPSTPEDEIAAWGEGPLERVDHTFAEDRPDMLVYTSDPLPADLEVSGTPVVHLVASSDAVDTDFAAVLTDVGPDGRSLTVAEGLVRAAYRDPDAPPSLLEPGRRYVYRIELNPTSTVFLAGHRVRLCVASAEFPAYDRNPNTGAWVGDDDEIRVATQIVYHEPRARSFLCLPIVEHSTVIQDTRHPTSNNQQPEGE